LLSSSLSHHSPCVEAAAAAVDEEATTTGKVALSTTTTRSTTRPSIRVAHLGNSIQYYNDCPRLLATLLRQRRYGQVTQDSCLRGGSNLVTLAEQGNGMSSKFQTPPALKSDGTYDIGSPTVATLLANDWNVVIINDQTQAPARASSRTNSKNVLKSTYLPRLKNSDGISATVIFLMTAAYWQSSIEGSDDLGTFDQFTAKLQKGYQQYQAVIPGSKIAPVGLAYQYLRSENRDVWESLYTDDGVHPSPHGTLLQAYVLYATLTNTCPPTQFSLSWWNAARYMQSPDDDPLPLPTSEEALYLRTIACEVCEV